MKISLWPTGVRIPQKYNVKVNKDCEESRGETVSYFQLIFLNIVYFLFANKISNFNYNEVSNQFTF